MGDVSGHLLNTRAGQGGAPPPGDLGYEISRRIAAGRAQIGPTNAAAGAKVGRRISPFFQPFQADPYLPPPIFGPSELIPVSFFTDSSQFERYDENRFGRLLDRLFRLLQQPLDQGKGTDVFMVSWAFR